ncbi:MAG TPA: NAD(P)H-binding protein, partial [Solirubrobacteraceae bacterium]
MEILVTGISGYIGSRLTPRLQRDGHSVRGFARRPDRVALGVPVAAGDAVSGAGLKEALDGIDVAYYLIHSMEGAANGTFGAAERTAAENFAAAAQARGVGRVVYLGGPVPSEGRLSPHLASRLEVERILLGASPCSVALRASIVIGARSRSFRFLVRLVERMPVVPIPAWGPNRTAPIDERDIVALLAGAATNEAICSQSLDAPGRDVVSYTDLIERIRDSLIVGRPTIGFRHFTVTPIASRIASV